jgi:hypothetical protein
MASGVEAPIEVNAQTGVMAVEAVVDGVTHRVVIDPGGGYSWWRGSVVRGWAMRHPDWLRAEGAVGQSNQAMIDEAAEQRGTVARVPEIHIGALTLTNVGILGLGPAQGDPVEQMKGELFWSLWGKGAPAPVDGWIGGSALTPYRVTFDYAHHTSRWVLTGTPATDELNSVPVSLFHGTERYHLGGIVRAQPGLAQARVGDVLVAVDGREATSMTWGQVISALHGAPGDVRRLTLERDGRQFTVDGRVEAFDGESP